MQLVKWESIKHEIEVAKDWDTIQATTNKVKAYEIWAKQTKQSLETQNQIAAYRLRLERLKGNWLEENVPHGGDRKSDKIKVEHSDLDPMTLETLGVTKYESSVARQIASIPEDTFNEFVDEHLSAIEHHSKELTTTGAVRLAKSIQQKREEMEVSMEINEKLAIDKELRALAKEVNMKYTKEQRQFFVSLIKQ